MREFNGIKAFGYFEGTPYSIVTDDINELAKIKNNISKKAVIAHISSLEEALASVQCTDMFTGEQFNAGFFKDGDFQIASDFLRYYKTQDIGIPYEYEEYLKNYHNIT